MRFTLASLSALALGSASFTAAAAQTAVSAPALAPAVDMNVPRAANSAVSFQTFPNARCVLGAAGTHARMTVYADDRGAVSLHVTPSRGGAANVTVNARCDARGAVMIRAIRLHVVARAPLPVAVRPAFGARPLVRAVSIRRRSPKPISSA